MRVAAALQRLELAALEAARLITRTREGHTVVVRRTARASTLLELYAA